MGPVVKTANMPGLLPATSPFPSARCSLTDLRMWGEKTHVLFHDSQSRMTFNGEV